MVKNNKAIVGLAIGKDSLKNLGLFGKTWTPYAERYGYDIVIIKDYIDDKCGRSRPPAWQKCLILEHSDVQKYDKVVWLDVDVFINNRHAPCIVDSVADGDRIGVVSHLQANEVSPAMRAVRMDRLHRFLNGKMADESLTAPPISERYTNSGLADPPSDFINTGVLVLDVRRHKDFLSSVYYTYPEPNYGGLWENLVLSYEILRQDMACFIDPRFNADYMYEIIDKYPFLLLKKWQNNAKCALQMRLLAAASIADANWFTHVVRGYCMGRHDFSFISPELMFKNFVARYGFEVIRDAPEPPDVGDADGPLRLHV